jgi:hypothetical protein
MFDLTLASHLDQSRRDGNLLAHKIPSSVTVLELVQQLGMDHASHLVAELYQLFPNSFALGQSPYQVWTSVPDSVVRGYYLALIRRGTSQGEVISQFGEENPDFKLKISKKLSYLDHPEAVTMLKLSDGTPVEVAAFPVAHSDTLIPELRPWHQETQSLQVLKLNIAYAFSSSQVLLDESQNIFVDTAVMPGGMTIDYRHDASLLGVTTNEVLVRIPLRSGFPSLELNGVLWLTRPLASSWGHWFYESLTRLALFEKYVAREDFRVALPFDLPDAFLASLNFLWPEARYTLVPPGTYVKLVNCFVINSRVCTPGGVFPSPSGHEHHLSCEPIGLGALRTRVDKRVSAVAVSHDLPNRVFLSRAGAKNSRSNLDARLAEEARSAGYISVNPESLNIAEEFALGYGLREASGLAGSQLLLALVSGSLSKFTTVAHDQFDHDSRGSGWCLDALLGVTYKAILGKRDEGSNYRAEASMHRDFQLSDQGFAAYRSIL